MMPYLTQCYKGGDANPVQRAVGLFEVEKTW